MKGKKAFILVLTLLTAYLSAMAQPMVLKLSNVSVKSAMIRLEKQGSYSFVYKVGDVDTDKTVSVNANTLQEALDQIFQGQNVSCDIHGNKIVITKGKPSEQPVQPVNKRVIRGKVVDNSGSPVVGAFILERGTRNGTTADLDGFFSLPVQPGAQLVVSCLGFIEEYYPIDDESDLTIVIKPDIATLNESVVIGYGTVRRKDLTGSVSQFTASQVQDASMTNVLQSMEGRVSGLTITPESGRPDAGSSLLIHGKQSINGTNSPIFVIDGTITENLYVSPNDIESVSVLKDAAMVAIYGARAANGVIVVTTKRGNKNTLPVISFKTEHSLQQEGNRRIHYVNADQWVELATEAYENAAKTVPWSASDLEHLSGIDVCWPDLMKRTGYLTTNNISINGGNNDSKYYISLNQSYNQGIIKGQDYRQVDLRLNGDYNIAKRITFGHSVNLLSAHNSRKEYGNRDVYSAALRYSPLNPAYDESGDYATIYNTSLQSKTPNPMWILDNTDRTYDRKIAQGNLYLLFNLFDGLTFTTRVSGEWQRGYGSNMQGSVSSKYGFEGSGTNKISKSMSETFHWIFDNILDYNRIFTGGHSVSAMLGLSAEKQTYEELKATRGGTPSNRIIYLDAGDPSTATNSNSITEWGFISQFVRASYSFRDKYYLNATVRRDGSSRLANQKYGVFPSVSAAWRINEEDFMKSVQWLDELKLRASWGKVGNILSISEYGTSIYLSQQHAVLNEVVTPGYSSINAVNTDLKWESTAKKDIGIDLTAFGNRFFIISDFYIEDTKDLLFEQPIPYSAGLSGSPYINAGHVRNKGLDLEVGFRQSLGDWYMDASLNFSHVNNKVVDLMGRDLTTSGIKEGYPIGMYYGYISDGIIRSQEELEKNPQFQGKGIGDIRFKDIDGDGKVNSADRDLFGKVFPDFTYGLAFTLSWKNLSLQALMNGVQGLDRYMLNGTYPTDMFLDEPNVEADYILDRFHPVKNPNGKYPKVAMGDPGQNRQMSDFWLVDASFFSIKNISLSYSFPKVFCDKLRMRKMKAYIGSQNLYTFGNPYAVTESSLTVPFPRIVTCGIQFSL